MIVVICRGCGSSIGVPLEEHKRNEYSERLADELCIDCKVQSLTTEAKLLCAIFGETNDLS